MSNIIIFIRRYADDVIRILAMENLDPNIINKFDKFITHDLYEHDIAPKNLILVQDHNKSNKYLDADIIIYNNHHNIKLTYHNKNNDLLLTNHQEVGRLYDYNDAMHIKMKINAFANLMIRTYDFTTYKNDCIQFIIQLIYEMSFLNYKYQHMHSAIIQCNRTRPCKIWNTICLIIRRIYT